MLDKNNQKIEFINWLLNNENISSNLQYLLSYVKSNKNLIDAISFTNNVNLTPRGVKLDINEDDSFNLLYFKNKRKYTDFEIMFHDLRLFSKNITEKLYIEITDKKIIEYLYVLNLIEDNPYNSVNQNINLEIDNYLEDLSYNIYWNILRKEIDFLLENKKYSEIEKILLNIEKYTKG